MRQVPQYLIIGNGRVARHLCHYFSLPEIHLPYRHWHRALPVQQLRDWQKDATHILLAIRDGAIEPFCDAHLKGTSATKVHFSGSLVTDRAFGAHPLMTFGAALYPPEKYPAIPFLVDDNAPDFAALLPGLPNPHARLPRAEKAKYHALCVMAGNFSCILWQNLFSFLENDLGLPPATAHMYLQQQTENLLTDPRRALTGPLVRGDEATIARNIASLADSPYQDVYKAFVTAWRQDNNRNNETCERKKIS